jgi:hypothetical protein
MPASHVTRPLQMAGSVIPHDARAIHMTGGLCFRSLGLRFSAVLPPKR